MKFIAAIEKIIELGDASIENIFQILQGLEDEFAKSSEKVSISANKLKNLVSEALQHKVGTFIKNMQILNLIYY